MRGVRLLRASSRQYQLYASSTLTSPTSPKSPDLTVCKLRSLLARCSSTAVPESPRPPNRPPLEQNDAFAKADISTREQRVGVGAASTGSSAEEEVVDILESFNYPRSEARSRPLVELPDPDGVQKERPRKSPEPNAEERARLLAAFEAFHRPDLQGHSGTTLPVVEPPDSDDVQEERRPKPNAEDMAKGGERAKADERIRLLAAFEALHHPDLHGHTGTTLASSPFPGVESGDVTEGPDMTVEGEAKSMRNDPFQERSDEPEHVSLSTADGLGSVDNDGSQTVSDLRQNVEDLVSRSGTVEGSDVLLQSDGRGNDARDAVNDFAASLESLSQAARSFARGAEHSQDLSYYHKLKEYFATLDLPEVVPKPPTDRRTPLIDQDHVDRYLRPLYGRGWRVVYVRKIKEMLDGTDKGIYAKALMRHFKFPKSYMAQEFFEQVMGIVKEENHHPTLLISSHDVMIRIHTHSASTNEETSRPAIGITLHDIRLAQLITNIPAPIPLSQETDAEYFTPTLVKHVHLYSSPINPIRDRMDKTSETVPGSSLFPPLTPCPVCGGTHWVSNCDKRRPRREV